MMLTRTLSMKRRELRERLHQQRILDAGAGGTSTTSPSGSGSSPLLAIQHPGHHHNGLYGEVLEAEYRKHLQEQAEYHQLLQERKQQQQILRQQQQKQQQRPSRPPQTIVTMERRVQSSPPTVAIQPHGQFHPYQNHFNDFGSEKVVETVADAKQDEDEFDIDTDTELDHRRATAVAVGEDVVDNDKVPSTFSDVGDNDSLSQILGKSNTSAFQKPKKKWPQLQDHHRLHFQQHEGKQQQEEEEQLSHPIKVLVRSSNGVITEFDQVTFPINGGEVGGDDDDDHFADDDFDDQQRQRDVVSPLTFDSAFLAASTTAAAAAQPQKSQSHLPQPSPLPPPSAVNITSMKEKQSSPKFRDFLSKQLPPTNARTTAGTSGATDVSSMGPMPSFADVEGGSTTVNTVFSSDHEILSKTSTTLGGTTTSCTASEADQESYRTDFDDDGVLTVPPRGDDNHTIQSDVDDTEGNHDDKKKKKKKKTVGYGCNDILFYQEHPESGATASSGCAAATTNVLIPTARQLIVDVGDLPAKHVKQVVSQVLGTLQQRFNLSNNNGQGAAAAAWSPSFWTSTNAADATASSSSNIDENENEPTAMTVVENTDNVDDKPLQTPERLLIPPKPKQQGEAAPPPPATNFATSSLFDCHPMFEVKCGGDVVDNEPHQSKSSYQMTSIIDLDPSLEEVTTTDEESAASSVFLSYQPSLPDDEEVDKNNTDIESVRGKNNLRTKQRWKRNIQKLMCICGKSKTTQREMMFDVPVVEPHFGQEDDDDDKVLLMSSINGTNALSNKCERQGTTAVKTNDDGDVNTKSTIERNEVALTLSKSSIKETSYDGNVGIDDDDKSYCYNEILDDVAILVDDEPSLRIFRDDETDTFVSEYGSYFDKDSTAQTSSPTREVGDSGPTDGVINKKKDHEGFSNPASTKREVDTRNKKMKSKKKKKNKLRLVHQDTFMDELDTSTVSSSSSVRYPSKIYKIKLLWGCYSNSNKKNALRDTNRIPMYISNTSTQMEMPSTVEEQTDSKKVAFNIKNGRKPIDPTSIIMPLSPWKSSRRNQAMSNGLQCMDEQPQSTLLRSVAISTSTSNCRTATATSKTDNGLDNSIEEDAVTVQEIVELVFFDTNPSLLDDEEAVSVEKVRQGKVRPSLLPKTLVKRFTRRNRQDADENDSQESNVNSDQNSSPSNDQASMPPAAKLFDAPVIEVDEPKQDSEEFNDPPMAGAPQHNENDLAASDASISKVEVDDAVSLNSVCRDSAHPTAPQRSIEPLYATFEEDEGNSPMTVESKTGKRKGSVRISVVPVDNERNGDTAAPSTTDGIGDLTQKKSPESWLDRIRLASVKKNFSSLKCTEPDVSTTSHVDMISLSPMPSYQVQADNAICKVRNGQLSNEVTTQSTGTPTTSASIATSTRQRAEPKTPESTDGLRTVSSSTEITTSKDKPWETERMKEIRARIRRVQQARESRSAALASSSAQLRRNRRDDLHLFTASSEAQATQDDHSRIGSVQQAQRPLQSTSVDSWDSGMLFHSSNQQPPVIASASRLVNSGYESHQQSDWSRNDGSVSSANSLESTNRSGRKLTGAGQSSPRGVADITWKWNI